MLVRRDALDRLGSLDENLLSCNEHLDLCLSLRQAGDEIWMMPSARVTYLSRTPETLHDFRYFLLRWSHAWNMASIAHFAHKYGLSTDGDDFSNVTHFLKMRRRKAFTRLLRWLAPHVSQQVFDKIVAKADKVSARLLGYRQVDRTARRRVDRTVIAR